MNRSNPRWVSKVHPLVREATEEDPLTLMADPVAGDPQLMFDCLLQEFAWLGYNAEQLVALFLNPDYPVLQQLHAHFGDEVIRQRVNDLVTQLGVLQFRESVAEPEREEELQLVQIQNVHGSIR
jgi:hypothetical protein